MSKENTGGLNMGSQKKMLIEERRQDKEYKDKELMWLNSERFNEKEID